MRPPNSSKRWAKYASLTLSQDERPKFVARSRGSKFEGVVSGEGIFLLKRVIDAEARD